MKAGKRIRVFLGVQEIAGVMERLNNAFHELGVKSDFYCIEKYAFSTEDEKKDMPILRKYRIHTENKMRVTKEWKKTWWSFFQMLDILHIFFHALFRYDLFIYIYGRGMFFHNRYLRKIEELEFFILKMFRKTMIMWFCGSDARPPYLDGALYFYEDEKLYSITQEKAKKVRMLEKYMTLIDFPASAHFHSKPYLIYNCIGVPIDEKEKVRVERKGYDEVTILHAPSDQKAKGTVIIRNILKEIQEEGYDFKYVEVSGLPHSSVLKKIAVSDIVIDQLYSDTPMAGFATEAAINGVPVVVGGYYADVYKKVLPHPIAPTVFCNPEKLKENIIYLLEHEEERIRIGREEKEYVESHCLATIVAKRFLQIFDDSYPKEWTMNPTENDYIWGWGLNKKEVINTIVRLIDHYGDEALCLDKSSGLYKQYMQLYNEAKGNCGSKEGT